MDPRDLLLGEIAAVLLERDPGHPLRVAVDGICGSGKTTFGDGLVTALRAGDREVIRLDPDGFHHRTSVRHRPGVDPAHGYYDNAFDFETLRMLTLQPLGPGGDRRYAAHVHDLVTDEVSPRWADAPADAIVVFDGTFVQRGALRASWDEVIYLEVARDAALERGVARDAARFGGEAAARAAYADRYMAACDIHLAEQNPRERAGIVVDNVDPTRPRLLRRA